MENDELIKYVEDNGEKMSNIRDKWALESRFFKIFVKFEVFLSNMFINYCIGLPSSKGYNAYRQLEFLDRVHLNNFLRGPATPYINYVNKIKLSKYIFKTGCKPFDVILATTYADDYNQIKTIRDYIAHESMESRSDYTSICPGQKFIEVNDFLASFKKGTSITR